MKPVRNGGDLLGLRILAFVTATQAVPNGLHAYIIRGTWTPVIYGSFAFAEIALTLFLWQKINISKAPK